MKLSETKQYVASLFNELSSDYDDETLAEFRTAHIDEIETSAGENSVELDEKILISSASSQG